MLEPLDTLILIAAAIALGAILGLRLLAPAALAAAPIRNTGLTGLDLIVAVALLLAPIALSQAARLATGGPTEQALVAGTPMELAANMLMSQVLTFCLPLGYLVLRLAPCDRGFHELGLAPRNLGRELKTTGLALLAVTPMSMAATMLTVLAFYLLTGNEPPKIGHQTLQSLLDAARDGDLGAVTLFLLSALVVAPLLEELLFRGFVQSALLNVLGPAHRWTVVLLAASVFTLVHVSGAIQWQTLPGLFVLAVGLGWVYERTGSLLPPVLMHMAFNTINVAMATLMDSTPPA